MSQQSTLSSKSLVLGFALSLAGASGLTGCNGTDAEPAESEVENVLVNAEELSKLKAGEKFNMDIQDPNVVYHVNYETPIDFSRIVVDVGQGQTLPIEPQLQLASQAESGTFPKPTPLAAPDSSFKISSDPASFGKLNNDRIEELKRVGYIYTYENGAPAASPQSTDDCIHAVCVFCFVPGTSQPWDWTQEGTPFCIYENHIWCD
jgi:hypothetical protein